MGYFKDGIKRRIGLATEGSGEEFLKIYYNIDMREIEGDEKRLEMGELGGGMTSCDLVLDLRSQSELSAR